MPSQFWLIVFNDGMYVNFHPCNLKIFAYHGELILCKFSHLTVFQNKLSNHAMVDKLYFNPFCTFYIFRYCSYSTNYILFKNHEFLVFCRWMRKLKIEKKVEVNNVHLCICLQKMKKCFSKTIVNFTWS